MNIDINAAFDAGMTEADIKEMMERALESAMEERKAQEAARLEEERKKATARDKEALKAEARAYLINAVIAYSEAFDLIDDSWDEEDVAELEALIIRLEQMAPMYIKLAEMQDKLDEDFFGNLFK